MGCYNRVCIEEMNGGGLIGILLRIEDCINHCTALQVDFAGLITGRGCMCGEFVCSSFEEQRICDRYCDVPCEGDNATYCGGVKVFNGSFIT